MKITIESTGTVVTINGLPARLWQGQTESGIPMHCFITRIAVEPEVGPEALAQFEDELMVTAPLRPELLAIPLRMIL